MTKLKIFPNCTEYPPQSWCYPPLYWCYPPHVLMLSPNVLNTLHCTEQPPQYLRYSPQYWSYPPTCTAVIPPQYWRYPSTVLNTLHSTDVIPTCTDLSPTVLNNLHITEAIPHSTEAIFHCTESLHSTEAIFPQHWCIPPMYWTTSTVLNRRYMEWFRINKMPYRTLAWQGRGPWWRHKANMSCLKLKLFWWLNWWQLIEPVHLW